MLGQFATVSCRTRQSMSTTTTTTTTRDRGDRYGHTEWAQQICIGLLNGCVEANVAGGGKAVAERVRQGEQRPAQALLSAGAAGTALRHGAND